MTIDGSYAYSTHDAAAKRSPLYKDAIVKVSNDMQRAMETYDNLFVYLSRRTPMIKRRSTLEKQLAQLTLKHYERKAFSLASPRKSEVESDLRKEADNKFFSVWGENSSKKNTFISDTLEEEFQERMSNWEELKKYHESIQNCIETQTNIQYQKEYDKQKQLIEDELYGDEVFVSKRLNDIASSLNNKIPFDLDLDVDYNKEEGLINAVASLPAYYNVLDYLLLKKAIPLANGKISIKDKLKRELDNDKCNALLGVSYFIVGYLFSLSYNIEKIRFSLVSGEDAYYWIEFSRQSFASITFSSLYPLQDFFSHPNVINYKKSTIEYINDVDFRQRIADALKASAILTNNPNLIVLSLSDAEKICAIIESSDDLKQAIKEAKDNKSTIVIADKRYRNVLNEIHGIDPQSSKIEITHSPNTIYDGRELNDSTSRHIETSYHSSTVKSDSSLVLYDIASGFMRDFYSFMDLLSKNSGVNRHADNLKDVHIHWTSKGFTGDADTSTYRGKLFFCATMDLYRILKEIYRDLRNYQPYCYPFALLVFKIYSGKEVSYSMLNKYESVYHSFCDMLKPMDGAIPVLPHVLMIAEILHDYTIDRSWYDKYLCLIARFIEIAKNSTEANSVYKRNIDSFVNDLHRKGVNVIVQ